MKIKETITTLEKREEHLEKKIQLQLAEARQKSAAKDKRGALFCLKRKKMMEAEVSKIQGALAVHRTEIHSLRMLVLSTLEHGRRANAGCSGLLFDIQAGPQAILIHALWAESYSGSSGTLTVTIRTAPGGWQANKAGGPQWAEAGVGQCDVAQQQTRFALRQPLRVEAGQTLAVYLLRTAGGFIGYPNGGDVSPVQGDGLVILKGTYTYSEKPFERVQSDDRFFAGSVEYERLPAAAAAAAAAAAPAGEDAASPRAPRRPPRWLVGGLCLSPPLPLPPSPVISGHRSGSAVRGQRRGGQWPGSRAPSSPSRAPSSPTRSPPAARPPARLAARPL
jgi:hypothetical protein